MRVRAGAVLAERDDRVEARPVGAGVVPRLLEPPLELGLGPADERLLRELRVDLVGDRRSPAQKLELARLLDGAQPFDDACRRDDLHAARAERVGIGEGEVARLDRDAAAREQLGERRQDLPRRPLERDAFDRARRLGIAEVRVERRVPRGVDEHRRVRAREPGQVADVDEVRDEQRLLEPSRQPFDPVHVSLSAASSSSARR